jgi:hypothetical protein
VETTVMLAWAVTSYLLLVFVVLQWWLAVPLALSPGGSRCRSRQVRLHAA